MKYISKKGEISELFEELKKVSAEQKKNVGKVLNQLKQTAESKLAELTEKLEATPVTTEEIDLTLPPIPNEIGNLHPLILRVTGSLKFLNGSALTWLMVPKLKMTGIISRR